MLGVMLVMLKALTAAVCESVQIHILFAGLTDLTQPVLNRF